ncbi:MAG: DUF4867 family protein [Ruminococcaceae bacterium]|nr:DUF4867 family protein [Oscillospiraceae bacterium]
MKVYKVTAPEFKKYGQVLKGYDFSELFENLKKLDIPDEGITYEASVPGLESCNEKKLMENKGFGGMPIQIGYVGGNNKILNCLEYHKSSEFNIALDDVVLVLGIQSEIQDGMFDTSLCKAFLLPAGTGVELYGTTLHYAPMNVGADGYRVACVLPFGTNGTKPEFKTYTHEDKMCGGSNKWIMAHKDAPEAQKGTYVGLTGENIIFEKLNF